MHINLPFIDIIWRVRSSFMLDNPMSAEEALGRLDPLFQTKGTEHTAQGDTITYTKKNPDPQDKLATFTNGQLKIVQQEDGTHLFYDLGSPALLWCSLAPLLFLAFAAFALFVSSFHEPEADADRGARSAEAAEAEEPEKEYELHWIDQMLGAPERKKPDEDEDEEEGPKHSPTTAYVLAGIFAVVYLAGRILEPYLIKRTFRKALNTEENLSEKQDIQNAGADTRTAPPFEEQ